MKVKDYLFGLYKFQYVCNVLSFLHNLHNGHNNCNTYMTAAKISRGEIIQILPSGKVMSRKTCQDLKVNPHEN